jgi:hypothetical protein
MQASRALAAEQTIALTAGVARDLIGQGEDKTLPKPRFLMAVFAFYGALGLLSAFGRNPSRVAVAFGGVAALTTVVVGGGGLTLANLFNRLGGLTQPATVAAAPAAGASAGAGLVYGGAGQGAPPGPTGPIVQAGGPSAPRVRTAPPVGIQGPVTS